MKERLSKGVSGFGKAISKSSLSSVHVAYFSMEIFIEPDMPTYAGGLGVLAGDMLRSMADLGVSAIGVSLLYKKGYFKQKIINGMQSEEPVVWKPEEKMKMLPHKIGVKIDGRDVEVGAWLYEIEGKQKTVPVIFLDTDLPANSDEDREITQQLYTGIPTKRLAQEIVLGIGGTMMIERLGAYPKKYHMNEGHSTLLALELCRKSKSKNPIEEVRKKCVFTTHTPVPAGHDKFPRELVERMLGHYLKPSIRREIYIDGMLNMTYLGLRFSERINGVAKKHTEVSRGMFPGYHIESITNGVNSSYWTSEHFRKLYDKYVPNWDDEPSSLRYMLNVPSLEIWEAHQKSKKELLDYVNKKHGLSMNQEVFTIGFARRATAYKRADLLFSDIERLKRISKNYKMQIIYGGKAHPNDFEGKRIIQKIIDRMEELKGEISCCYLEEYDARIAKMMVAGVDVWLNTPMRPWEASGTSGMKAAHNGVPHFSVLDGWWLEGHVENVTGWSIGARPEKSPESRWDEDLNDLYSKLEYVILPTFYEKREEWIKIMKHAIAVNASFFNSNRMVMEYIQKSYFK